MKSLICMSQKCCSLANNGPETTILFKMSLGFDAVLSDSISQHLIHILPRIPGTRAL